ncbi:hypothetical protein Y032_0032g2466 [Ancylostoma ceylanicum]|uniref:Uncharacterized protein n=1 Tax=Ancylostoma ceylanicum TaxID=53326 RepID=A0A016UMX2_9BILA|nr:hypothetical protein Y032_0032g2466 [Ancylostoma ceylanicum]
MSNFEKRKRREIIQKVAGSLPGLPEGDRGGRRAVNPVHCIAGSSEQKLRLTLDLRRSGTSDRDGLQSAALPLSHLGYFLCRCLLDKFSGSVVISSAAGWPGSIIFAKVGNRAGSELGCMDAWSRPL